MLAYLFNFVRWILSKIAIAALIVVLGASAVGLWLFVRDRVDFDQWRSDAVRALTGRRTETKAALADVNKRLDRISAEITAEQERGRVADGAIAKLAPDLDLLAEIASISMLFAQRHGERLGRELGIDHTAVEINLDSVKAGFGVDTSTNSMTPR